MNKIGIVVLNFKNYMETITCVHSILEQKNIELEVVIVDNGSKNESYEKIKTEFFGLDNITVIQNEANLGYAKGNNIGVRYLRCKGLDFIIICNSDIIFSSSNILETMAKSNDSDIGVMIPIIRNLDGTIEMRAQYRKKFFPLRVLKELLKMQCTLKKTTNSKITQNDMKFLKPGIQDEYLSITGSIFALTPSFFKCYSGLYSGTFLYVEELATLLLVYKARLKTAIINTDCVIHKGGASTGNNLKEGTPQKRKMIAQSARKVTKLIFFPRFIISKL